MKTKSTDVVAIVELSDRSTWGVDEWNCANGTDCAAPEGSNGAWIGFSSDGDWRLPFVAVQRDGSAWIVCEDCASDFEAKIDEAKALDYGDF